MNNVLERFETAHQQSFQKALREIENGKKISHWMWFIFPQLKGLGLSERSKYYALGDLEEAQAFLDHPVLGKNLLLISSALLKLSTKNATAVMGQPDDIKLHSSMTLFALLERSDPVFQKVLDKYFDSSKDVKTMQLLA
ncbi:MAG: DUF1810 domain-containing protein [Ferruginibacter sp.]